MSNKEIKEKIARLKKEKNAVILAHYYVAVSYTHLTLPTILRV